MVAPHTTDAALRRAHGQSSALGARLSCFHVVGCSRCSRFAMDTPQLMSISRCSALARLCHLGAWDCAIRHRFCASSSVATSCFVCRSGASPSSGCPARCRCLRACSTTPRHSGCAISHSKSAPTCSVLLSAHSRDSQTLAAALLAACWRTQHLRRRRRWRAASPGASRLRTRCMCAANASQRSWITL